MEKNISCIFPYVCVGGASLAIGGLDPSLVGWWTFDEGTGTIAYDYSGQGNDGTFQGNPKWVPGKINGALEFDGDDDQIKLKSVFMTLGSSSNTLCLWIKVPLIDTDGLTASERVGIVLGNYNDTPNTNWELHAVGQMRLYWNGGQINQYGTTDLRDNSWHHLAWVRDKAANANYMYIDGRLEATIATLGTDITFVTTHCIGGDNRGDSPNFHGLMDDVRIYDRALTEAEIKEAMKAITFGLASNPNPADGSIDVPRDVILSWTPGDYADKHDVYLGTNFNDVNDTSRTNPLGALVSQGQTVNAYDPAGLLDFGQTYYWRVDEVNGPPDYTVYKGEVWSFTTVLFAYPIEKVTATASSSVVSKGPENTVNGSRLDESGLLHGKAGDDNMWMSDSEPAGAWIGYEFDKVYKLDQMWVWNYNDSTEPIIGFGVRDATIEYSSDETNWTTLATVEFARASGVPGYAHNTTVDLSGVVAKYVKITANSNWGGILPQYGLSEVRFFYIPVFAREPSPASEATDVDVDVTLGFKAGREAAKHDVYLSTDQQAVIDGTAPVATVTKTSHSPLSLDLDATYYWRVDEVNEAETPAIWKGDVWDFGTQQYLVMDDFESYNDLETTDPKSNRIFNTWIDGYGVPANGSLVGYENPPFAEKTIVHSGDQSMPLSYDNSTTASYSEATVNIANLKVGNDWTEHGIKTLSLWFCGEPNNFAERMYVKLNGSKVVYDGQADNITEKLWQPWNIELSSFGVNLRSGTELKIGLERSGAAGGKGVVYFDDIRLYPYSRQLSSLKACRLSSWRN